MTNLRLLSVTQINHVNRTRVLIGLQLPAYACQSFTPQIRVYQHEKVVKNFAKTEASSIGRQLFANVFADCFCAVDTHTNLSLPTGVWQL